MQPDVLFFARVTSPAGAAGMYFCEAKKVIALQTFGWQKQFRTLKVEVSSLSQVFSQVRCCLPIAWPCRDLFKTEVDGKFEKAQRAS